MFTLQTKDACTLQLGLALLPPTVTLSTPTAAQSQGISSQPNATPPRPQRIPLTNPHPKRATMNRVSVCPRTPSPLHPVPKHNRETQLLPSPAAAYQEAPSAPRTHRLSTLPGKPLLAACAVGDFGCGSTRGRGRKGQLWYDNLTTVMRRQCSGTTQKAEDKRQAGTCAPSHPADV